MKLVISTVSYQKEPNHYAFRFSVHEEGTAKEDGQLFDTAKEAQDAAKAINRAEDKAARKAMKAEAKAVESAEKAAERATKAVRKAAERAAAKLAEEAAKLEAKKARLDEFAQRGMFALVG
jgi:hypothetical protein